MLKALDSRLIPQTAAVVVVVAGDGRLAFYLASQIFEYRADELLEEAAGVVIFHIARRWYSFCRHID